MKALYFKRMLKVFIHAWPYIWFAISMSWLVIIVPILTLVIHLICWLIDSADDDIPVNHGFNYNILTGEIDPHKRADGPYMGDNL